MGFPCRFVPQNYFDTATLTSTLTPLTNTSLNNLKNARRARTLRWQSASGTMGIYGTYGGDAKTIACIALDRFNFFASATVRFRAYVAADWTGGTVVDTGSLAAYNALALGAWQWGLDPLGGSAFSGYLGSKFFVSWFAQTSIGSWLLEITDTGNSLGYSELSRVVLGDKLQATYSAKFGLSNTWDDSATEQVVMDGGSTISDAKIPRRTATGEMTGLTATERTNMYSLVRYNGKSRAFLISFQAGEGSDKERDFTIVQAKFRDTPQLNWLESGMHAMPFSIVEA
jgi:hypothetical protein